MPGFLILIFLSKFGFFVQADVFSPNNYSSPVEFHSDLGIQGSTGLLVPTARMPKDKYSRFRFSSDGKLSHLSCLKGTEVFISGESTVITPSGNGSYCRYKNFIFAGQSVFDRGMIPFRIDFGDVPKNLLKVNDIFNKNLQLYFYSDETLQQLISSFGIDEKNFLPSSSRTDEESKSVFFLNDFKVLGVRYPKYSELGIQRVEGEQYIDTIVPPLESEVVIAGVPCKEKIKFRAGSLSGCVLARDHFFSEGFKLPRNTKADFAQVVMGEKSNLIPVRIGPLIQQFKFRGKNFTKGECVVHVSKEREITFEYSVECP